MGRQYDIASSRWEKSTNVGDCPITLPGTTCRVVRLMGSLIKKRRKRMRKKKHRKMLKRTRFQRRQK